MDTDKLFQNLAEEMIRQWDIMPTGSGLLVTTDWQLPNNDRIEIHVRPVGEREDLYLVTDGGELFNFLFSHGIDLSKDNRSMKVLNSIAANYGAQFVEYQMAKGANDTDLHSAIRLVLEAVKDAAYILWHKLDQREKKIH
jgi:hypothetical protein